MLFEFFAIDVLVKKLTKKLDKLTTPLGADWLPLRAMVIHFLSPCFFYLFGIVFSHKCVSSDSSSH